MKTTIYIARHSEPLNFKKYGDYNGIDICQLRNEKNPLSSKGELLALKLSELEELKNVEYIFTSNYVRAISTAKYLAEKNNILINIDDRLGERKFGVPVKELTRDFFKQQQLDWDYKLNDGESLNETSKRMKEAFNEILAATKGHNTFIVSHGTALTSLLKKYCKIEYDVETENIKIIFNNVIIFNGKWKTPELFKMIFEDNELISIENIEL